MGKLKVKTVKVWGLKNMDGKIVMSLFNTRRETQAFIVYWGFKNTKVIRVEIREVKNG